MWSSVPPTWPGLNPGPFNSLSFNTGSTDVSRFDLRSRSSSLVATPAAVFLWLGGARRCVLCRVCSAGSCGGDTLDLYRADDWRVWLVPNVSVGCGVSGRCTGGDCITIVGTNAGSARCSGHALRGSASNRSLCSFVVPDAVADRIYPAFLYRADEFCESI